MLKILFLIFIMTLSGQLRAKKIEPIAPEDLEGIEDFDSFTQSSKTLPLEETVIINEQDVEKIIENKPKEEVLLERGNLKNLQDYNPEIDNKVIDQLASEKQKLLDGIIHDVKKSSETRYNLKELQAYKIQLKDIMYSQIKLYQVHRGTKLIRLKDNKVIYIPKSIFVRAHIATDGFQNRYIINKNGRPVYRVAMNKLSDISKITNLYRPPFVVKPQKVKKKIIPYDEKFEYIFDLKSKFGASSSTYFNDLMENINDTSKSFSLEVSLFNVKTYFVQTGISLYYHTISGDFNSPAIGNYNFRSLSIGPSFKSMEFLFGTRFTFQPKFSLIGKLDFTKDETQREVDMIENSLAIGFERSTPFFQFGRLTYGLQLERSWMQADASNIVLNLSNTQDYVDSFGVFFGHQSTW